MSSDRNIPPHSFRLALFAGYFQFSVRDDDVACGDLSGAWTAEAVSNLLALSERAVGVGTVRNARVPVYVDILDEVPKLNSAEWDRLNSCTIACKTGRLVFMGCTDYFPEAKRVAVTPGKYRLFIGYRNLDQISEDGLEGEDSYHLFIAPEP